MKKTIFFIKNKNFFNKKVLKIDSQTWISNCIVKFETNNYDTIFFQLFKLSKVPTINKKINGIQMTKNINNQKNIIKIINIRNRFN